MSDQAWGSPQLLAYGTRSQLAPHWIESRLGDTHSTTDAELGSWYFEAALQTVLASDVSRVSLDDARGYAEAAHALDAQALYGLSTRDLQVCTRVLFALMELHDGTHLVPSNFLLEGDLLHPYSDLIALPSRVETWRTRRPTRAEVRHEIATYFHYALDVHWPIALTSNRIANSACTFVLDVAMFIAGLCVHDFTFSPLALRELSRMSQRTSRSDAGLTAANYAAAVRLSAARGVVLDVPIDNAESQRALILNFDDILTRAEVGVDAGTVAPGAVTALLSNFAELVQRSDTGATGHRLAVDAARLIRMSASNQRDEEALLYARALLDQLAGDESETDIANERIRVNADLGRVTGTAEYSEQAGEEARALLDMRVSPSQDPMIEASISLGLFTSYKASGSLEELEAAYALNRLALGRERVDESLRAELLLNGGAMAKRMSRLSGDTDLAETAENDYRALLDHPGVSLVGRKSVLLNILALATDSRHRASAAAVPDVERWARELRGLAGREPRYLAGVAAAYLFLARRSDTRRAGLEREALAVALECLAGEGTTEEIGAAYDVVARIVGTHEDWSGPPAWLIAFEMATTSGQSLTTQLGAAAGAIRTAAKDPDVPADALILLYRTALGAIQSLLGAQASGPERQVWVREAAGLASSALATMADHGKVADGVALADRFRAFVGTESVILRVLAGKMSPASEALEMLRRARTAGEYATEPTEVEVARRELALARSRLEAVGGVAQAALDLFDRPEEMPAEQWRPIGRPLMCYCAVHDQQLVVCVVGRQGPIFEVRRPAGELVGMVNRFYDAYAARGSDFPRWAHAVRDVGSLLWDGFVGEIWSQLDPDDEVSFVPCGLLGLVPLHLAGRFENGERVLATDDRPVSYSLGLRFTSMQRALNREGVRNSGMVGSAGVAATRPLLWTKAERSAVSDAMADHTTVEWLDDETPDAFLHRASSAGIIHIAGHGSAWSDGAPGSLRLTVGELTEAHIASQSLVGVDLVVLTACESAAIDPHRTDEMRGLPLAFLTSGAAGVLAPMWACDDAVAAWMAPEMYRYMASGLTPVESLRRTQALLRSADFSPMAAQYFEGEAVPTDSLAHEVYWGAFSWTGDNRVLHEPWSTEPRGSSRE